VLRTICAYTLLMLFFAFVGVGIARPETDTAEARMLRAVERMTLPVAPAPPTACRLAH
jgi:hypothetical protein